jgi:signal transduction histidine kinase
MTLVQTLLIIFSLLNLAFATFLYLHGNKRVVITFYALISVFASLWSLSTLATGIVDLPARYFTIAVYGHYIFGYLAYLSFFWFAFFYPKRSTKSTFWPTAITIISVAFLALISLTKVMFNSISAQGPLAQRLSFNEPGYVVFIVMLSFVFFAGLLYLLRKHATAANEDRYKELDQYQIYFAILTNFVAGILGISLNLILPLYGDFRFFYLNPILVTLALMGIGLYNLLKYRLFNTKVILAEFFTAGIWIVFLARIVQPEKSNTIVDITLFLGTVVFGIFLIQSVNREVNAREEVERLAKQLEKTNERLKELDRQKTEFVSIASHQLRSPLTAIKGYASLLLEGSYGNLPKGGLEAIKKIFDSSRYMAASIEDFLSVSRIELGTAKYDMKPLDAASMAKEITEELLPAAHDKKLTLEFKDRCDGKCSVLGDMGKLRQVVLNLVDNSIKYTPHGGVTVTADLDRSKQVARISITDTGVGIPNEVMPTLFKKFSRAKNANEVNVMGTGLGLFVAKQFVEAHKGRIWAESLGQGKGSSFVIELPLVG